MESKFVESLQVVTNCANPADSDALFDEYMNFLADYYKSQKDISYEEVLKNFSVKFPIEINTISEYKKFANRLKEKSKPLVLPAIEHVHIKEESKLPTQTEAETQNEAEIQVEAKSLG